MAVSKKDLGRIIKNCLNMVDNLKFDYPDVKHHIAEEDESIHAFQQCVLLMIGTRKDGKNAKEHVIASIKKEVKKSIRQFTKEQFVEKDFDERMEIIYQNIRETMYDKYVKYVFNSSSKVFENLNQQGVHTVFIDTGNKKVFI
jgi:hypothetical protein